MYPKGHWKDIQNHILYAHSLAAKNRWTTPKDWSNLSQKHFKQFSGGGLLSGTYGGSPWQFIIHVVAPFIYPNYLWLEWKIGCQATNSFWKDKEKVRLCLDVLAAYEGFTTLDGFYKVSQDTYKKHHITSIQNKFGSHLGMLKFAYPEKNWKEWKFYPVSRGFWNIRENVLSAVKDIETEEGIIEQSGWYKHTCETINKHCGDGLLANNYGSSLIKLLQEVYPEYPWKPYLLVKAPHKYWQDDGNCKGWLSDFMDYMRYNTPEDLYKTRYESLIEFPSARGIIDRFNGSYINTFVYLYPELDITSFFKAGQSKIANEYLSFIEGQFGPLEKEFRIPGKRWRVDGFHHITNTVYEFLGDYWHGNPSKYALEDINPTTKITYGKMYSHTMERISCIRECGFTVVFIWENDWKKKLK